MENTYSGLWEPTLKLWLTLGFEDNDREQIDAQLQGRKINCKRGPKGPKENQAWSKDPKEERRNFE